MTRVKICGLTREQDVQAAVAAGADAIGVIVDVTVDTPREIPAERAARLLDSLPPFVTGTVVTMGENPSTIEGLVDLVGADAVQVHGDLPPGDVSYLAASTDAAVVTAVDAADPEGARQYAAVSDALLVDSTDDAGGGGTGRTHDWATTSTLAADLDVPIILAGGLTPENVGEAVQTVDPFAVDVASGVEARGGEKDHDKVEAFVTTAKERAES